MALQWSSELGVSRRDGENRLARSSDVQCVVIEAVLFHKREGRKLKFLVGEITETVNHLFHLRDEPIKLTERKVGEELKRLGFRKRRQSQGMYLILEAESQQVVERWQGTTTFCPRSSLVHVYPTTMGRQGIENIGLDVRVHIDCNSYRERGEMKRNSWNRPHIEEMRSRFLKCGIAVNDPESEEGGSGLIICPYPSLFDCRATIHYPCNTRYTLSLKLLSDEPDRVISAFRVTSEWEKEIRVLQKFEQVPQEWMDWDPEENILNNRLGQAVGPTRCREGLLLAEGLRIPATNGRTMSASITVWVYDQFEQVYSQVVDVAVIGRATEESTP